MDNSPLSRRSRHIFLLILLLISVFGSTFPSQAAAKLNKTKVTINVGEKCKLRVKGFSGKVVWKTGNKKIATVKNGKVTGKKVGTTTITAKLGKQNLKCKVTVRPTYRVNGKAVSRYKLSLEKGESKILKIAFPLNCGIFWHSENTKVATGNWSNQWTNNVTTLTITATGYGDTTITLDNKKNRDKVLIPVHVKAPYDDCKIEIPKDSLGDEYVPGNRAKIQDAFFYDYLPDVDRSCLHVTLKLVEQENQGQPHWQGHIDCYDAGGDYLGTQRITVRNIGLNEIMPTDVYSIPGKAKRIVFRGTAKREGKKEETREEKEPEEETEEEWNEIE